MYQQRLHGSEFALRTVQGGGVAARFSDHPPQAMPRHGWIMDPSTQNTKRFHPDEKSWNRDPRVFVDSGRPFPDQPPLLTTRVHLRRETAEQLWRELLRVGWRPCRPQWGADVDV